MSYMRACVVVKLHVCVGSLCAVVCESKHRLCGCESVSCDEGKHRQHTHAARPTGSIHWLTCRPHRECWGIKQKEGGTEHAIIHMLGQYVGSSLYAQHGGQISTSTHLGQEYRTPRKYSPQKLHVRIDGMKIDRSYLSGASE